MDKKLTTKERAVLEKLVKKLRVPKRKSTKKLVIAMVGLVGSGKSTVGAALAKKLGAVVISANDIRVELRRVGLSFKSVHTVAHTLVQEVLARGGNAVVDSDYIDSGKQNDLKKTAKDGGANIYFIRILCEHDTRLGRIVNTRHSPKSFYGGALSEWRGKNKGAVIQLREMWRRTPRHYTWSTDGGGKWVKKSMPFVYAELDTTYKTKWEKKLGEIARRLL